ncbi:MAG: CYTH domain-containing protein [Lachnospiraceae bacterium]
MEIERKYLIKNLPSNLDQYSCRSIEQGYLNTEPVVRIRKDNDTYELTYKSKGLMVREEYNLPLTQAAYEHLKSKIDGILISKNRYMIPLSDTLTGELDIFKHELSPLILIEVEFDTIDDSNAFVPPSWFGEEVTFSTKYHNSTLSLFQVTKS